MRKKSIQERVDREWKETMELIAAERVARRLEKKTVPIRELTRMSLNADNWPKLMEELISKPRKKDR